jgi:hypothetical protein
MSKKLSPKQFFLLLYLLTVAFGVTVYRLSNLAMMGGKLHNEGLFYSLLRFLWPFGVPLIIIAIFFVVVAMPRARIALSRLEIPEKYSPKHFLLLLWLTAQAFLLGIALHGAIYALGIACFGWGFWGQGDEPVFFCIALFVVPAGVVAGAIGRVWEWAVVKPIEEMKAKSIQLPNDWRYFAPFSTYAWLWKFSKGIEAITDRRIRAAGVFAAVFFLGVVGFVIIRAALQSRLSRVAA